MSESEINLFGLGFLIGMTVAFVICYLMFSFNNNRTQKKPIETDKKGNLINLCHACGKESFSLFGGMCKQCKIESCMGYWTGNCNNCKNIDCLITIFDNHLI